MASLVAQLVKNPPAMQETLVLFLDQEVPLERDRLPTPVFFSFPGGSHGKKNLPAIQETSWLGRSPGEGKYTTVFQPGWGCKELDTTE